MSATVDGSPVLILSTDYFAQEGGALDRREGDIVRAFVAGGPGFLVHYEPGVTEGPGYYELTEQGLAKLAIVSDQVTAREATAGGPVSTETETLADYITERGITMDVVSHGLTRDSDGWEHYAYTVTLHHGEQSMTTGYRMGTGLDRAPELTEVLESLTHDADAYRHAGDFEDFADEFGYDRDSRKAEGIFNACRELWLDLLELLGGQEELDLLTYAAGDS